MQKDVRRMYSGKEFVIGIALVMGGLYGFGLIHRATDANGAERHPGMAMELYKIDPYTYETPISPAWLKTERAIRGLRPAREITRQDGKDGLQPWMNQDQEASAHQRLAERPQRAGQSAL